MKKVFGLVLLTAGLWLIPQPAVAAIDVYAGPAGPITQGSSVTILVRVTDNVTRAPKVGWTIRGDVTNSAGAVVARDDGGFFTNSDGEVRIRFAGTAFTSLAPGTYRILAQTDDPATSTTYGSLPQILTINSTAPSPSPSPSPGTPSTQSQSTGLIIDCNKVVTTFEGTVAIDNPCTIQDFFQQFVVIAQFAYGIIVIIGVLMIVYGGYQFLIAAGRQEKISEGKRVITGTVIGLIVTVSAYVIINFTVAAITGGSTNSLNPLSGVALVFPRQSELTQPFSGRGGTTGGGSCHTKWDTTCNGTSTVYQVYCADKSATSGNIRTFQQKLNDKGCQCGESDGCFGSGTVSCVRRIQIANFLAPTGAIDTDTETAINSGTRCDGVSPDFVKNISSKLPDVNTTYAGVPGASAAGSGCCVVRSSVGGTPQPYYCLDSVSLRTCTGLGGNNKHYSANAKCVDDPEAKTLCGVCKDTKSTLSFEGSGSYWCNSVISPAQIFQPSIPCAGTSGCDQGLRSGSPFTPKP